MKTSRISHSVAAVLVVLLGGVCLADEPAPLLGQWAVVAMEARGKEVNEASWAGMRWTFAKDTFLVPPGRSTPAGLAKKPPLKCSYVLDDTKTPHHFNWILGQGDKKKKVNAIYELNDDVLKVSFAKGGAKRPKDFSTKDTESVVYTFKRIKAN